MMLNRFPFLLVHVDLNRLGEATPAKNISDLEAQARSQTFPPYDFVALATRD